VGATTNLAPALTLGCGAVGGSSTSDNVTPMHLINIRRVARNTGELASLRGMASHAAPPQAVPAPANGVKSGASPESHFTREDIEAITKAVLSRMGK
jgi:hypothetical protein